MKGKLMKQGDRYVLYAEGGHKVACTSDSPYKKLSLKNCKAIERGYDLEELAVNECINISKTNFTSLITLTHIGEGFKAGFQKALEILGDKKFTEQDVRKAISYMFEQTVVFGNRVSALDVDRCIQSLQQTEWDVEVEMGDVFIHSPSLSSQKSEWKKQPKLDAEGCIILKRKV